MKKLLFVLLCVMMSYNALAIRAILYDSKSLLCGDDIVHHLAPSEKLNGYRLADRKVEIDEGVIKVSYYFETSKAVAFDGDTLVLNDYLPTVEALTQHLTGRMEYEIFDVIYLDEQLLGSDYSETIKPFESCYEIEQRCESVIIRENYLSYICPESYLTRSYDYSFYSGSLSLIRTDTLRYNLVTCLAYGVSVASYEYVLQNLPLNSEFRVNVSGSKATLCKDVNCNDTIVESYWFTYIGQLNVEKCTVTDHKDSDEGKWFYPNPVKDVLHLKATYAYQIFDVQGDMLLKGISNQINVEQLQQGTYFLKLDEQSFSFIKD